MQTAVSDNQLQAHLAAHGSTAGSSTPLTPSFAPNTPSNEHPPHPKVHEHGPDGIPELDLRQPVSTLLKLGTQRAHVKAEHSAGAAALVQGALGLEEYIRWLAVLWRIYDALELGLQVNSTNPILAPTYDPTLLARAPALAADITYLLTLLPASSTSPLPTPTAPFKLTSPSAPLPPFPLPAFLLPVFEAPPTPLVRYLSHIRTLGDSEITAPGLLAHAYVRYLGDLSGGQFIGARVKRSYKLPGAEGTKFYQFEFEKATTGAGADAEESRAEAKRKLGEVKDWYRRGMDEGVGEDQKLKADLVEEANLAFSYNTDLFSVIRVPPSTKAADVATETKTTSPAGTKEFIQQSLWFLLAAVVGMALNFYVAPIIGDRMKR
ncbi:hypothetical protein IAT38_003526 [Cryptococcus sp. DSM 104549]